MVAETRSAFVRARLVLAIEITVGKGGHEHTAWQRLVVVTTDRFRCGHRHCLGHTAVETSLKENNVVLAGGMPRQLHTRFDGFCAAVW